MQKTAFSQHIDGINNWQCRCHHVTYSQRAARYFLKIEFETNARVAVARRSNKESESNQKSVAGEGERGARQIRAHSALQCRNLIGEENSDICQVPYTKYFKMCFIQQTNL